LESTIRRYLSIKKRRIVVDVGDFDGERADALKAGLAGVGGLDGDADKLAVLTFSVEYLETMMN